MSVRAWWNVFITTHTTGIPRCIIPASWGQCMADIIMPIRIIINSMCVFLLSEVLLCGRKMQSWPPVLPQQRVHRMYDVACGASSRVMSIQTRKDNTPWNFEEGGMYVCTYTLRIIPYLVSGTCMVK